MGKILEIGLKVVVVAIDVGIRIYNDYKEKKKKEKEWSKQSEEDKYKNEFQRDFQQEREIMNNYKRRNQKYNKMCNSRRDYRGYEEDEDLHEFLVD